MYDLISGLIDHSWITTNAGEQQYIYYTCAVLIIMLTSVVIDGVFRVFTHFMRGGK